MEEELKKTEDQINALNEQKSKLKDNKTFDIGLIMKYVRYILEHLEYLLLQQMNPLAKAGYFAVITDKVPTYQDIVSRSKN